MGTIIDIPLSAQAITDINATAGGTIAEGLHPETYSGGIATEGGFFSLMSEARTHRLVLICN